MAHADLKTTIEAAWEARDTVKADTKGAVRDAVETALDLLDKGKARVAEKGTDGSPAGGGQGGPAGGGQGGPAGGGQGGPAGGGQGGWVVNQWLKKAVLLSFRLSDNHIMPYQKSGTYASRAQGYDKVPLKFADWSADQFKAAGFRAVPGAIVRHSAFIAPGAILMPSFVNLGAYVDTGTMVDTWVTVGSCAQIGKNVHLSGGVGIGGVLEPMQAGPTIIEDNCFIGARSEVVEGVVIGEGSVLSMGVFIGSSTTIIDRATGERFMGRVPPYSVVVAGSLPGKPLPDGSPGPSLYCAVIVKRVDERTRSKTSINELLRD